MVDLVGSRVELRRAGRQPLRGPVPVPRRAHAVVRDQPGREALLLLRLRRGRRRVQVRPGDRGRRTSRARWSTSPTATASRSRSSRRTRRRPSGARERERLLELLERTAAFYVRYLWDSERGRARARVPRRARPRRGRAARVPRRLRAERVGQGAASPSRRAGLQRPRARATPGLASALAEGGAHLRPLPPADHVPAVRPARARARLRRARDGRRPEAEVPQLLRRRRLPQGPPPLRRRHRARAGGQGGRGRSSPRATPTSSRCTRPGCATRSG